MVTTELSAAIGTLMAHTLPISPNTQYLHLIPATIITMSALGLCLTIESPRWLLLFGHRAEQAKASLHLLQESSDPRHNICQVLQMFQKEEEQFCATRANIIVVRTYLHSLTLAACLLSLPCVSGMHVYDFYSEWVFKFAGIIFHDTTISLSVLSASIRVAAVGFAAAVFFVMDGAKSQCVSLISSTGMISIALCTTGLLLFSLEQGENWIWEVPWLPLAIHLLFHTAFWFGVGSQTFITAFQCTPSALRPSVFSLAGGFHWLLEMTLKKFLAFMIETIHPCGTFWFYAATSATGLVLVVFIVVPEIHRQGIITDVTGGAVTDALPTPTDKTQTGRPT